MLCKDWRNGASAEVVTTVLRWTELVAAPFNKVDRRLMSLDASQQPPPPQRKWYLSRYCTKVRYYSQSALQSFNEPLATVPAGAICPHKL